MSRPVLFIDNGGYTIKAALLDPIGAPQRRCRRFLCIPNCVGAASYAGRGLVGAHILQLPHYHGFVLRRPVDRGGFIADAELQRYIWEYVLQQFAIEDEAEVELMVTVPFGAPHEVAQLLQYLALKRMQFHAVTFVSATFLALVARDHAHWLEHGLRDDEPSARVPPTPHVVPRGSGILVDVGFSATTIAPYIDYRPVTSSIVHIDIGGKLLTNRLKEHLSFSQVNLLEDGWLVNSIKEQCCRVSMCPAADLASWQERRRGTAAPPHPPARSKEKLVKLLLRRMAQMKHLQSKRHVRKPESAASHYGEIGKPLHACQQASADAKAPEGHHLRQKRFRDASGEVIGPGGVVRKASSRTSSSSSSSSSSRLDSDVDSDGPDVEGGGLPKEPASEPLRERLYFLPTIPSLLPLGVTEDDLGAIPNAQKLTESMLQTIILRHEAFLIPELLFHPVDVGISQCGVAAAVTHTVFNRGLLQEIPFLRDALLPHGVTVFGGSTKFAGFDERLRQECQKELVAPVDGACGLPPPVFGLIPRAHRCNALGNGVYTPEEESCTGTVPHRTVAEPAARDGPAQGATSRLRQIPPQNSAGEMRLHARELQPLFGAIALFHCDECDELRKMVRLRCRFCPREVSASSGFAAARKSSASRRSAVGLTDEEQVLFVRCILENLL